MLGVQALLAVLGMRVMSRRVLPGVHHFSQPGLVLDVWGPLALVLPMLAFVRGMDHSVAREGWIIVGGPMVLVMLAIGMAMVRSARIEPIDQEDWITADRMKLAGFVAGVGALTLLLGAAHDLTVWVGQVAFAIAAVLLWVNTPDHVATSEMIDVDEDGRIGGGLALTIVCAIGQALAIWSAGPEQRIASMAISLMIGAFMLASTARLAGPSACLRMGGWAVVYGVLFGLGTISLMQLIPNALHAIHDPQTSPTLKVAFGFGALAIEATAVLMCSSLILIGDRLPRRWRMMAGVVILIVATVDIARRLTNIEIGSTMMKQKDLR